MGLKDITSYDCQVAEFIVSLICYKKAPFKVPLFFVVKNIAELMQYLIHNVYFAVA
jgi:hypothetical protein